MNNVSQNYLDFINDDSNIGRSMKNKVVIDGVEYLSDTIKSNPKISHKATSFIGGFPAKKCDFEILNIDGSLNLNNKEIEVYKGLEINGSTEWVKMGIFHATDEDITTNQTTKSITFKGNDRAVLFDVPYVENLDWSTAHTGLEIVQDACMQVNVALETESFNFASYSFSERPNFEENITCRQVISRIAEIGGEIAYISRDGGLKIVGQNITNQTTGKRKREKLTKENQFGAINTVVLGKDGIEDDIVYKNESLINKSTTKNLVDLTKTILSQNSPLIKRNKIESNALDVTVEPNITVWAKIAFPINDFLENGELYTIAVKVDENSDVLPNGNYGTFGLNRVLKTDGSQRQGDKSEVTLANTSDIFTRTTAWTIDKENYDYFLDFFPAQGETITTPLNLIYKNIYLAKETKFSGYVPYKETGIKEKKILDNPYVDLIREDIIEEVASHIIGMSIIPFSISNFIDDFIYDINDVISVVDNNGIAFNAVILEYETSSRIKSNVAASTQTESITNHKIAGSAKQQIAQVKLQVDHLANEIRSIVSKGYVNEEDLEVLRQSLITQTDESITMTFTTLTEIMNSANADTQKQFQEMSKYIRFDGGVSLGEVGNEVTLRIENDTIHFNVSDVKIMEITPNGITIEKIKTQEIDMGDFAFILESDGSLSLV